MTLSNSFLRSIEHEFHMTVFIIITTCVDRGINCFGKNNKSYARDFQGQNVPFENH